MNTLRTALGLLVLSAFLPGQAGEAQAAAATAEYEKMVAAWKAETQASRDAVKKVQATEEYQAAQKAKDTAKIRELTSAVKRPDAKALGERALKLADQFGDDGLRFLTFAASNAVDKDVAKGIVDRVRTKYGKLPALAGLLESPMGLLQAIGDEEALALLEGIAKDNPDGQCKAWSLYWQSVMLGRGKPSDEQKAKAAQLVAEAEKFAIGDLADRLAAPRFQQENLQIGMTAPDIVGEDIDGVAFKLSDYRGKVVVLDFWGYW